MKRFQPMSVLACLAVCLALVTTAQAQEAPYVLRDTTSLPPPSAGHARLLLSRERMLEQGLKPEYVFVDRTPFGQLPPRSASTGEITPGWHRIWLGRGATTEMWFEAVAGERYLVRLREALLDNNWRADLVRDSREGYRDFALGKGMKLAVTTTSGFGALRRNLEKLAPTAKADSLARGKAQSRAHLPIVIAEAWYRDLQGKTGPPSMYAQNPAKLTLDARSLTFKRADTTLTIPRNSITTLRYGGMLGQGTVRGSPSFSPTTAASARRSVTRWPAEGRRPTTGCSASSRRPRSRSRALAKRDDQLRSARTPRG
jgi:hypothetical protein